MGDVGEPEPAAGGSVVPSQATSEPSLNEMEAGPSIDVVLKPNGVGSLNEDETEPAAVGSVVLSQASGVTTESSLNEMEVGPSDVALKPDGDHSVDADEAEPTAGGSGVLSQANGDSRPGPPLGEMEAGPSCRHSDDQEDNLSTTKDDSGYSNPILEAEAERLASLDLPTHSSRRSVQVYTEEERASQYTKLVDLLSKSTFYTNVLRKKLDALNKVKSNGNNRNKRKQPTPNPNENAKEEKALSPSKRPKREQVLQDNQRAMYEVASEVMKDVNAVGAGKSSKVPASEPEKIPAREGKLRIRQPRMLTGGKLRDYQLEGYQWLKALYDNGVNGILADEMGLGKTIQVIALLCHLIERKVPGPFLIVGPLSTLPNWMIEFERFAPQLHVILFYGSRPVRESMYESLKQQKRVNKVLCYPIVVTSYETPIYEKAFMKKFQWKYIIVDEGHRIKNYNAVLAKTLRSFDSAHRLLLTGTPLHNSLSELWSLLHFLVPEIFDNLEVFESWFRIDELKNQAGRKKIIEEEREKKVLSTLHQILGPFMLRRIKSQVELNIPPKKEVVVQVPMTDTQFKLYQAVLERNFEYLRKLPAEDNVIVDVDGKRPKRSCYRTESYLEKSEDDLTPDSFADYGVLKHVDVDAVVTHAIRVKMQNRYMSPLKQIASHPYLVHYPLEDNQKYYKIDEDLVMASGKFRVLDAMLERLHARGHRVLLFSTMTLLLTVVEDYLSLRPYRYERLDGSVSLEDRKDAIQRFNGDPDIFLFLVSTRAGGLGINLTGADTVILLDSDWNPQVDLQAQDRCHRIGQTKPVIVYRLVTTGTMDEHIQLRAGAKRLLEKMVIHKAGANTQRALELEELKAILESKDHSEIVCTDNQAVLSDEQLEKLLDRSDMKY